MGDWVKFWTLFSHREREILMIWNLKRILRDDGLTARKGNGSNAHCPSITKDYCPGRNSKTRLNNSAM